MSKGDFSMEDFLRNNPLLNGMDTDKLDFILNFAAKDKPKSMKDAMPFLLANMNKAKRENIQFSHSEIRLIADILCKDLSPSEQEKVKRIMSMLGQ